MTRALSIRSAPAPRIHFVPSPHSWIRVTFASPPPPPLVTPGSPPPRTAYLSTPDPLHPRPSCNTPIINVVAAKQFFAGPAPTGNLCPVLHQFLSYRGPKHGSLCCCETATAPWQYREDLIKTASYFRGDGQS